MGVAHMSKFEGHIPMHFLLVLLQGWPFELLLWLMPFEVFVGQTDSQYSETM